MQALNPGIYAILDGGNQAQLADIGERLADLPVRALQIRAKSLPDEDRRRFTRKMHQIFQSKRSSALFVINDDWELAQELGVTLHLGQDDLPIAKARKILGPDRIIGISTHDFTQAVTAQEQGAQYIGFGPIYETKSKINSLPPRNLSEFAKILQNISIPAVAIGGLHAQNLDPLLEIGVKHFALLSALHEKSTQDLQRLIETIHTRIARVR